MSQTPDQPHQHLAGGPPSSIKISGLLAKWHCGDWNAFDQIFEVLYKELSDHADKKMRFENDLDWDGQDLLHNALESIRRLGHLDIQNTRHFINLALNKMDRQIYREKEKRRRPKHEHEEVELNEQIPTDDINQIQLIIGDALNRLEKEHGPAYRTVVECKFFLGLSNESTAEELKMTLAQVRRKWMFARDWLASQFREAKLKRL